MRRGPPASALAALRLAAPVAAATALGATPGAAFSSLALGALLRIDSVARVRRPSVYFAAAAAAAVGFAAVEFLWVGRATAGGFARGLVYAGLAAAGPFLGPGEPRSVTLAEPLGPFESRLKRVVRPRLRRGGRAARAPRRGLRARRPRSDLAARLLLPPDSHRAARPTHPRREDPHDGRRRRSRRPPAMVRARRRLHLADRPRPASPLARRTPATLGRLAREDVARGTATGTSGIR
jgi:hypothetical protein